MVYAIEVRLVNLISTQSDTEISNLIFTISIMNSFNRLAVSMRQQVINSAPNLQ
ncbi:hypothetical protein yaldo0001_25400 [Yersinia aldovae ATCC 35236]|nr:hypothetical protein yaldo0001_25400 [Yersinia aldovae ATCC 35236]